MATPVKARSLFDTSIVRQAIVDSFRKLTPQRQVRNPVMFVVYVGSIFTTALYPSGTMPNGLALPHHLARVASEPDDLQLR